MLYDRWAQRNSVPGPIRGREVRTAVGRLPTLNGTPGGTHVVVGGRAAGLYRPMLEALGARVPSDLQDLRRLLTE